MTTTLTTLARAALKDNHDETRLPVVRKELLHYDILFALKQSGLLDGLVFQGGTSLRLCYGSGRYSEDLDFAGGKDFTSLALADLRGCIESYLGERYGLAVAVKDPASLRADEPIQAALNVDKWQVAVTTDPGRPDLPKQRIKIEVANVPVYTVVARKLQGNYRCLPDGYKDVLLEVETADEIMADKLVALAASQKYVRHRDIWDLIWLRERGASVRAELVERKIEDYRESCYEDKLIGFIEQAPTLIASGFQETMERFLHPATYHRTLADPRYTQYITRELTALYTELRGLLYGCPNKAQTPLPAPPLR